MTVLSGDNSKKDKTMSIEKNNSYSDFFAEMMDSKNEMGKKGEEKMNKEITVNEERSISKAFGELQASEDVKKLPFEKFVVGKFVDEHIFMRDEKAIVFKKKGATTWEMFEDKTIENALLVEEDPREENSFLGSDQRKRARGRIVKKVETMKLPRADKMKSIVEKDENGLVRISLQDGVFVEDGDSWSRDDSVLAYASSDLMIDELISVMKNKEYFSWVERISERIPENWSARIAGWIIASQTTNILPHLFLTGKAGSGKTTIARAILQMVGGQEQVSSFLNSQDFERIITETPYLVDNIGSIKNSSQDILSGVSTGGSVGFKAKYSNVTTNRSGFSGIFTSISLPTLKSDLATRIMHLEAPVLTGRRTFIEAFTVKEVLRFQAEIISDAVDFLRDEQSRSFTDETRFPQLAEAVGFASEVLGASGDRTWMNQEELLSSSMPEWLENLLMDLEDGKETMTFYELVERIRELSPHSRYFPTARTVVRDIESYEDSGIKITKRQKKIGGKNVKVAEIDATEFIYSTEENEKYEGILDEEMIKKI